jgi:hypothetical protein
LELDGRSLAEQPYLRRREELEGLGLDGLRWALTPSYAEGEAVWSATGDLGLEGVVAKDPRSPWVPRRSRRWLKCKHWRHATFAVMGGPPSSAREPAGLVVGAAGAIGELRVAGIAPLHLDQPARQRHCCVGEARGVGGSRRSPVLGEIAWASSSKAAATRRWRFLASTPSS